MLGSTVPRKVSQAAQTAALMSSWLTEPGWVTMSFMFFPAGWRTTQVLGDRLELCFTVADESVQGLALMVSQRGQRDDAALRFEARHRQHQLLQHRPADAELAAAFGRLQQLALARRLVDLPGHERGVHDQRVLDSKRKRWARRLPDPAARKHWRRRTGFPWR